MQIWTEGVYNNIDSGCLIDCKHEIDRHNYGVDPDGPVTNIQTNSNNSVPDIELDLSEGQMNNLEDVRPFQINDSYGINQYLTVLQIIKQQ